MYGTDLSVQIENLMPFVGLGFILGLLYDILSLFRRTFRKTGVTVFVVDFCFCIFVAVSSFLLLLGTANGFIRVYLLVAEILGAVIYFLTFGILVSSVVGLLSDLIKKCFSPFFKLRKMIFIKIKKITEKLLKFIEILKNKLKKPLKDV